MAIGFKHGSSGGVLLGITVVPGTTKPANPKENTIWANSNSTMGSWDISPTEPHRVSRSRNLIVYPYRRNSGTNSGVTFTVDTTSSSSSAKGTITVNGTNTSSGSIVFRLSDAGIENREMLLQPGTYCICGNCESSSSTHRLILAYSYDNWATTGSVYDNNGTGTEFTLTKVAKVRVSIQVQGGKTVANAVYKPMIVKAGESTTYTIGNATGQIWVKTDAKSTVSVDALKGKNSIVVQPRSVYEYTTNDGWVERSAEIYQYGAWAAFPPAWDGYFYNAGDLCTDVTGGWTTEGWTRTNWNLNPLAQINSSNMYICGAALDMSAVGTAQKVDLSSIDTLTASINQTGGTVTMCISESNNHSNSVASKANTTTGSSEISLDVSRYNGSYYIIIFAHGAGSEATVTNVRGE